MERFTVSTSAREVLIDITAQVQRAVAALDVDAGAVTVFCPHTTAGLTINENADPDVPHDILCGLRTIIPRSADHYRHVEGNSDSHLKASLMGSSVVVLVESGRLQLGRWQGVFLCEFDGPRRRQVWVSAATESG